MATTRRAASRHRPRDGTSHLAATEPRAAAHHPSYRAAKAGPRVDHHRSIHLAIGPGGVLLIDSKQYRGRLRLDQHGMLWQGHHLLVSSLRKVRWAADQADEVLGIADIQIPAVVAVHGTSVPWGNLQADGVTVVPARQVPDLLQALPPVLGPERVAWLADRARLRFHAAA
jgi:hypothetical protein